LLPCVCFIRLPGRKQHVESEKGAIEQKSLRNTDLYKRLSTGRSCLWIRNRRRDSIHCCYSVLLAALWFNAIWLFWNQGHYLRQKDSSTHLFIAKLRYRPTEDSRIALLTLYITCFSLWKLIISSHSHESFLCWIPVFTAAFPSKAAIKCYSNQLGTKTIQFCTDTRHIGYRAKK